MPEVIGDLLVRLAAESTGVTDFINKMNDLETTLAGAQREAANTQAAIDTLTNGISSSAASIGTSVDGSLNSILNIGRRIAIRQMFVEFEQIVGESSQAFEKAEAAITASTGLIGNALQAYNDQLKTILSSSVQTADQVGIAVGDLIAAFNLPPDAPLLTDLSERLLDLAKVSGLQVKKIADDAVALQQAWNISPDQMLNALERLNSVAQGAHIPIDTLAKDLVKFQPLFDQLGVGYEQAAQWIGKMKQDGADASLVLASLRGAMDTLAKDGATNASAALGILIERIKDAKTPTEELDLATKAFHGNAALMVKLINDGTVSFAAMKAPLDALNTPITEQAKAMKDLSDEWQQFKNSLSSSEFMIDVGKLLKDLLVAVNGVGVALSDMGGAIKNLGQAAADFPAQFSSFVNSFANAIPGASTLLGLLKETASAFDKLLPKEVSDQEYKKFLQDQQTAKLAASGQIPDITDKVIWSTPTPGSGGWSRGMSAGSMDPNGAGGTQAPAGSGADQAAVNKLEGIKSYYEQEKEILKQLQQELDLKKGIAEIEQKIKLLREEQAALKDPTSESGIGYKLAQDLALAETAVKFYQANFQAQTQDFYNKISDMKARAFEVGADAATAEKLLGLPDPHDLDNATQNIIVAFGTLEDSGGKSAAYLDAAWAKATAAIIANQRKAGEEVTAADVIWEDQAALAAKISGMDFGLARQALGLTTVAQALDASSISWKAYDKVVEAVAQRHAEDQDELNAEIDALRSDEAAAKRLGVAFEDAKQARLDFLQGAVQVASINTDQAYAILGVPNPQQTQTTLDSLTKALGLVKQSVSDNIDQVTALYGEGSQQQFQAIVDGQNLINKATLDGLNIQIATWKSQGKEITDAVVAQQEDLQSKIVAGQANISSILARSGLISVQKFQDDVKQMNQDLLTLAAKFGTDSGIYIQKAAANAQQIVNEAIKAGQAITDAESNSLVSTAEAQKRAVLTLQGAYQALGTQSKEQLNQSLLDIDAYLKRIDADTDASLQQRILAHANAALKIAQIYLELGQKINQHDAEASKLIIERHQIEVQQIGGMYKVLADTVANIYNTLAGDLSSGILGVANKTETVSQAFQKMGQDVEKILLDMVIKNILLTQLHLNTLQTSLNNLFGGGSGSSATSAATSAAETAVGSVAGDGAPAATSAASSAASSGGAIGSALQSITSVVTAVGSAISAISGIIGDVQNVHISNLLGEIEVNTRRIDNGINNAGTGVGAEAQNIANILTDMNAYLNSTLNTWLGDIDQNIQALHGYTQASLVVDLSPVTRALIQIDNDLVNFLNVALGASGVHGSGTSVASASFDRTSAAVAAAASAATAAADASAATADTAVAATAAANAATTASAATRDAITRTPTRSDLTGLLPNPTSGTQAAGGYQNTTFSDPAAVGLVPTGVLQATPKDQLTGIDPNLGVSDISTLVAQYATLTDTISATQTALNNAKFAAANSGTIGDAQAQNALATQLAERLAALQAQQATLKDTITTATKNFSQDQINQLSQTVLDQLVKFFGIGAFDSLNGIIAAQRLANEGYQGPTAGIAAGSTLGSGGAYTPANIGGSNAAPTPYVPTGGGPQSQTVISDAIQQLIAASAAYNKSTSTPGGGAASVPTTPYYGPTMGLNGQYSFPSISSQSAAPTSVKMTVEAPRVPQVIQLQVDLATNGANIIMGTPEQFSGLMQNATLKAFVDAMNKSGIAISV